MNTLLLFLVSFACLSFVESVMFQLHPNTQKCLREKLKKDAIMIGTYEISHVPEQKVDYVVTDSKGGILAQNFDAKKGTFSLCTEHKDVFEICFKSKVPIHERGVAHDITLHTQLAHEKKSYQDLEDAKKLKPMELVLKKLENLITSIDQGFLDMRQREISMRDTNELTNKRVVYLSILSMTSFLSVSLWRVLYLKKYFEFRKLIE